MRRPIAYGLSLVSATAATLAVAPVGFAASGGGGLMASAPSTTPPSQPGNVVVSASGDGMSIQSRASAILRGRLSVSGSTSASESGQIVQVERLGRETHYRWAVTATTRVRSDGSFSAVWKVNHIGRFQLRAVVGSVSSHAAAASPTVTITAYRPSVATIYGPGLWGHSTACGQTLSHHTIGVANRTLPCGTQVALYYHGHTLVVPVIDRGPYANGADWDLTAATAHQLGVTGTATIDAVSLPKG